MAEWTIENEGSKKVKIAGLDDKQQEGSKKVKIPGLDDKQQITAVFAATISGGFLVPQLVYKGTTQACLPTVKFPDSWHITYTHNHWCNETTIKIVHRKFIVPYIQRRLRKTYQVANVHYA